MSDQPADPVVETPADPAPVDPPSGFPQGKPIAEMSTEEQVNYWKHYARQHENAAKAFGQFTPEQVTQMASELDQLRTDRMTDQERALAEVKAQTEQAVRAEVTQEWQGRFNSAKTEAVAGRFLDDAEELKAFMAIADISKFAGEDGLVDEEILIGHLTALYGQRSERQQGFGSGLPQHVNWGQHSTPAPAGLPGSAGRAEAARRRGQTPPTT